MARNTNFTRHPSPSPKYPFVGDNYLKYGEQAGYVYYPYDDSYYIDKKAAQKYAEDSGQVEKPKEPAGLGTVLAGTAGLAGLTAAAQQGGRGIINAITGTKAIDPVAGLGSTITDAATTQATNQGLLGLGGNTAASTAPQGVGTALNGGTIMTDGTVTGSPGMISGVMSNLGSLGGLTGAGVGAGVLGGIALGAKGAKDLLQGNETKGGLDWASRATLGIATGGLSELARFAGLGRKPTTEVEDKKLEDLKAKGLLDPSFTITKEDRSRAEQLRDLEKMGAVDEKKRKWLETGDEQYLTGQDLQGYAAFLEKDPKDVNNRVKLAEDALRAGAVNEHHGTIDVDWKKLEEWRKNNQQPQGQPQAQPSTNKPLAPQPTQQVAPDKKQGLLGAFR